MTNEKPIKAGYFMQNCAQVMRYMIENEENVIIYHEKKDVFFELKLRKDLTRDQLAKSISM